MLSESGMTFLAAKPLARRLVRGFPQTCRMLRFWSGPRPVRCLGGIQASFLQGARAILGAAQKIVPCCRVSPRRVWGLLPFRLQLRKRS